MGKKLHLEDEKSEYEMDLEIDPDALDVALLNQPGAFMRWSEKSADAKAKVDRAKMRLDVVEAECASNVRSDPEKYGLEKITESAIRALVIQSDEYQEAMKELIAFKHESDILAGAVRAMDQRRASLENLVRLLLQNYFATPAEPRNVREEFDSHQAADKVARERIQKRRDLRRKK